MKRFIKTYAVPVVFLIALSTQITGQIKRDATAKNTTNTSTKRTVVTNNTNRTLTKRIPSSKVTYRTTKKKVIAVRNIQNRTEINHKGQNFYYSNNKYYTQSRGRYIAIAPKIGFRIKVLPTNYKRVRFNKHNYYNANGIFYTQINSAYEVVDPEVGTIVYELPNDYEIATINGQKYYEYANVLYEKIQVEGTRAYEVVGIIDME